MKKFVIYFFLLIAFLFAVVLGVGYYITAPGYSGKSNGHFDGKVFKNPSGAEASGFGDLVKWMLNRDSKVWNEVDTVQQPQIPHRDVENDIHITYINHSTFLIQTGKSNILTDPIFSERASPFSWAGPKRMRPPGIPLDKMPPIDAVIISHNHYDHLDRASVVSLNNMFEPLFIVPLGVARFLENNGIDRIVELDWWEQHEADNIKFESVPAQHFSGRGMFDRDQTLWAGYVIHSPEGRVYFAGDTGYDDKMFREIGYRAGPIDIALIPIGAYKPAWFMSPIHVSPEEAVKIHKDVSAEISIAMHYGTFPLADDGQHEPVMDLQNSLQAQNIHPGSFIVLPEGKRFSRF